MRARVTRLGCLLLTGLLASVAPSPAHAFFGEGAEILSASIERQEQGDDTTLSATVAAGGGYAVLQTRARNFFADDDPDPEGEFRVGGLFRRDLASGRLELVAGGDRRREADGILLARGAQNPSVSADGRFVAFSTGERLVPADTNVNVDVYVRDMDLPRSASGAFELISAQDGSAAPARYGGEGVSEQLLNPGAEVTRGAALSEDGRRVAFRTANVPSTLPDRPEPTTEGQQVFLRDRAARTTRLITRRTPSREPSGGAIGPTGISGDGSTVVWTGRNAQDQTAFVPGEGQNPALEYYLWQRVEDGPDAPTRRITGLADPDDPGCSGATPINDDPSAGGPCYGPLAQPEGFVGGIVSQLPAMSRDGRRLAFLTTASKRAELSAGISADLFVTDMSPGLTRKEATVELTRDAAGETAINAPLDGIAMSADGRFVAATSFRTTFLLPALRQLGPARANAAARELYLVDLEQRTLERVLRSYTGEDAGGSVEPPVSLDETGRRLVFVSAASNLFFGDANDRLDAFAVGRLDAPPAEPPPPAPEEPPPSLPLPPADIDDGAQATARRLPVFVRRGGAGEVRLVVTAPAAGRIAVVARGRPAGVRRARVVARATGRARRRGRVTLRLRVARRERSGLRRARTLRAQAEVTFRPARGTVLRRRVTVVFQASRGARQRDAKAR